VSAARWRVGVGRRLDAPAAERDNVRRRRRPALVGVGNAHRDVGRSLRQRSSVPRSPEVRHLARGLGIVGDVVWLLKSGQLQPDPARSAGARLRRENAEFRRPVT